MYFASIRLGIPRSVVSCTGSAIDQLEVKQPSAFFGLLAKHSLLTASGFRLRVLGSRDAASRERKIADTTKLPFFNFGPESFDMGLRRATASIMGRQHLRRAQEVEGFERRPGGTQHPYSPRRKAILPSRRRSRGFRR